MTENEQKRLEKLRAKISQYKAQEQNILNRAKSRQQKQRTRRLIQNGALAEKYLRCEGITPQDFEKLLQKIVEIWEVKEITDKILQ